MRRFIVTTLVPTGKAVPDFSRSLQILLFDPSRPLCSSRQLLSPEALTSPPPGSGLTSLSHVLASRSVIIARMLAVAIQLMLRCAIGFVCAACYFLVLPKPLQVPDHLT